MSWRELAARLLAMLWLLGGCSSAPRPATQTQTIAVAPRAGTPLWLHPQIASMLFAPLARCSVESNGMTMPTSDDGRSWTLRLVTPVRFHDGSWASAAQLRELLQQLVERQRACRGLRASTQDWVCSLSRRAQAALAAIDTLSSPSSSVIEVRLSRVVWGFPQLLCALPGLKALPTRSGQLPIGSGNYQLVRRDAAAVDLRPNAMGFRRAKRRLLRVHLVPDGEQRLLGLLSGAYDGIGSLPPMERAIVEQHPDYQLVDTAAIARLAIIVNGRRLPALALRQRLLGLIDGAAVARLIYQGAAQVIAPPRQHRREASGAPRLPARMRLLVPADHSRYLPNVRLVGRLLAAALRSAESDLEILYRSEREYSRVLAQGEFELAVVPDEEGDESALWRFGQAVLPPLAVTTVGAWNDMVRVAEQTRSPDLRRRRWRAIDRLLAQQALVQPLIRMGASLATRRGARLDGSADGVIVEVNR